MRKITYFLTFLSVVILWSCSYSETKKERFDRAVTEFNENIRSSDIINYYPDTYIEIKTDSIIESTFKVHIKNYSSNSESVLAQTSNNKHNLNQKYHKEFRSEINVQVSDRIVYQRHLKASLFDPYSDPNFWNNATLEHVWIDQWNSNSNSLAIKVSFLNPLENTFKLYELRIDKEGNESKRLIDQNS